MEATPQGDERTATRSAGLVLQPVELAADGFPIDPSLRKRARIAAIGHGLLALYYLAVVPFVLKGMRWSDRQLIAQDLLARSELLLGLAGYLAANVILALCAWNVISMHRSVGWLVAALSLSFTVWTCGSLGFALWIALGRGSGSSGALVNAVNFLLVGGYLFCAVTLWRAVAAFDRARVRVRNQVEGRIGSRPLDF